MIPAGSLNLSRARVLIVEGGRSSLSVAHLILSGFGAKRLLRVGEVEAALEVVDREPVDLLVCDGDLGGGEVLALVRRIRRTAAGDNRYVPVILTSGHCPLAKVKEARDCGANFVLRKPLSPSVMLTRILWAARDPRPFVECDVYAGPDRRVLLGDDLIASEAPKRRRDDL